ncbi:MAG: hypothetical protein KDB07_03050, partial [Planctomycetes bacterium]|nr:hypothetical protein [Planctomycetota bacterium]
MKIRLAMAALLGAAAIGVGFTACGGGSFVGPPQGSTFGGRVNPLIGASPFTFEPEVEQVTGFAVDHFFINCGADTNESFTGGNIPIADGINALADAEYEQFVCGNCTA